MDLATIIGFLGTIGMIAGAMISAGGLGSYIDVPSILIVFGGSFFGGLLQAILKVLSRCFLFFPPLAAQEASGKNSRRMCLKI